MDFPTLRRLLFCTLALLASPVLAQRAPDAKAEMPKPATTLQFNSTFNGYRAYTDQPVESWREANDNVGRIGGWRAYAKEAAQAEGASKDGAMPGHQHHHGSMGGKP